MKSFRGARSAIQAHELVMLMQHIYTYYIFIILSIFIKYLTIG